MGGKGVRGKGVRSKEVRGGFHKSESEGMKGEGVRE